jgi:ubiquitin-protein ligase
MENKNKVLEKSSNRLLRDLKQIMKNPLTDNGIYYHHSETEIYKGYALIIGPEDSPYENGYYFFEFSYPENYPFSPPKLKYCTNNGMTRFNPNLYRNGKVCLSILNTWQGEQWTSCQTISTILLTLITVFNNNPLVNEPGYSENHPRCKPYRDSVEFMNYKTAILDIVSKKLLPIQFDNFYVIVKENFDKNREKILKKISELKKSENNNKCITLGNYDMKTNINYDELEKQFNNFLNNS